MKLYNLYESLLRESSAESCVASFGKELFGQNLGGNERNTNIEDKYADEIYDFTDNMYGEETRPEFIVAIKNLKGCVNTYPEILIPNSTTVYRGEMIEAKYFITNKLVIQTSGLFNYTYKAPSMIQSWSHDIDVASTFGNYDTLNEVAEKLAGIGGFGSPEGRIKLLQYIIKDDVRLPFIFQYKSTPNDFLFKSKYFKKLSSNSHEDEIIRINNKPINVKAKLNNHDDVFLSSTGLRVIKLINLAIQES